MFLIFISLITGTIGIMLGSALGLETVLGVFGFLCPSIFLFEKMYVRVEAMESASGESEQGQYE
ncbi:hypothetical protein [Isachenkonia alkalipeptolytica]|uniref:Uncharacterized protein n=1 Tax=Isachenkonia alkalipeptolytica TaxID=2565777 RepID=A0AA43XMR9_9CLOT|nr:hypothetical protein [Isachenkonia alkalipeptolytica]NBG89582.1 hypothetical protein [Isachenkonia alkalipeptolytica]